MLFQVISRATWCGNESDIIYLQQDRWDDFSFKTTFQVFYLGERLGSVKISFRGMKECQSTYEIIPKRFKRLKNGYFSLWQTIFYKGIMPSEKVLDFPVDCNTLTGSVNL
ncbi:hypothetical protein [Agathobaculum sp. Marseille-P7918]|uniref:hypothetical protein n=1 Tax=Agathobaculum sp. Marseille-P7918 TaxID=2479843 RepID=UPI000F644528|nr:hypothetical protein [Agathobaculum sp. Marseille-P7918]